MSYHNAALENYNYYSDPRVAASMRGNWYKKFDSHSMTVTVELTNYNEEEDWSETYEVKFPVHFAVCDLCDGRGSEVSPSIDAGGLSQDDFYDDPEFYHHYMSGSYDQQCSQCNGLRVTPEISTSNLNDEQKAELAKFREQQDEEEANLAEHLAELRMGC